MSTPDPLPRVGVLVLRVETQPGHPLITVTVQHDVNRELAPTRPAQRRAVADEAAALALVERFLRSFRDTDHR